MYKLISKDSHYSTLFKANKDGLVAKENILAVIKSNFKNVKNVELSDKEAEKKLKERMNGSYKSIFEEVATKKIEKSSSKLKSS